MPLSLKSGWSQISEATSKMLGLIDGDVLLHWAARASDTPEDTEEKLHELFEYTKAASFATDFRVAIKGKDNYRKDIFADYKRNRRPVDPQLKVNLVAAAKLSIADYGAEMAHGQEADDLVRIWSEEAKAEGLDSVVIAEDKDLNCIPGPHFNPKKDIHFYVTEDDADLLYHQQLLTGDSADNIKGLWKVGPKTAQKFLADVPMGERMDKVIEVWQEREPEDWYERLDLCGKLITIRRTHDELFDLGDYV